MRKSERREFVDMVLRGDEEELIRGHEQDQITWEDLDLPHNAEGDTPLISACQMGLTTAMHFLLERGADVTLCNHSNQTALHASQPDLQGELLRSMLRPLPLQAHLLQSAWQGNLLSLQHLLAEMDLVDVDAQNQDGLTPLMLAVRDVDLFEGLRLSLPWEYSPVEVVRELLALSSDLEIEDLKGSTALQYVSKIKSPLKDDLTRVMLESLSHTVPSHLEEEFVSLEEEPDDCPASSPIRCFHTHISDCPKESFENTSIQAHYRDDSKDKGISHCSQSSMPTLREQRQANKDVRKDSRWAGDEHSQLAAKTNSCCGTRNRTTSLPLLQDRKKALEKVVSLNSTSEFHGTSSISIPQRAKGKSTSTLQCPLAPQLSQSAPSIIEPLLHISGLLQVRANIHNRLRVGETECEVNGLKGSLPSLCQRPIRTPKLLAPLDRGHDDGPMFSERRHQVPLRPISLVPTSSACRFRRERFSRRSPRAFKTARGGSEESTSSSTSSQGSLDLENDESDALEPQQKSTEGTLENGPLAASGACSHFNDLTLPGLKCTLKKKECATECSENLLFPVSSASSQSHSKPTGDKENERRQEIKSSPPKDVNVTLDTPSHHQGEGHSRLNIPVYLREEEVEALHPSGFHSLYADDLRDIATTEIPGPQNDQQFDIDCHHPSKEDPTISEPILMEKTKPTKLLKNNDRKSSISFQTNHSFNVLANKTQNRGTAKGNRKTLPLSVLAECRERNSTNLLVDAEPNSKTQAGVQSNTAGKTDPRKNACTKQKSAPELLRRSSADSRSFGSKAQTQKQHLKRDLKSARHLKKSLAAAPRAKSAVDCITYNDMFQKINQGDEGPAIFEMFATPIYENLRVASSLERSSQEQSVKDERKATGKQNSSKLVQKSKRKKTTADPYSQAKGKQSRSRDALPRRSQNQQHPPEIKDEVTVRSRFDQSVHRAKSSLDVRQDIEGMHNHESEAETKSEHALSVIEEIISPPMPGTQCSSASNPSNHSDKMPGHCPVAVSSKCETEMNEDGISSTFDSVSHSGSFRSQTKINTWTYESSKRTVSPVYSKFLHEVGEGPLTDDLLRCLAEELISLEEKDMETLQPEKTNRQDLNNNLAVIMNVPTSYEGVRSPEQLPQMEQSCFDDDITWTRGEVLGRGAYGTVYCGLTSKGQLIAVKQVDLDASDAETSEREYLQLQREVDLLKNLHHTNIVGFLGTVLSDHVVNIFMEYVPGGSIASVIHRFGPLPERVLALYTRQILEGVTYLHANRVIHRDLKGNNVMLMPTGVVKLIDFGCARRLSCLTNTGSRSDLLKSVHGTPYWMAPEVINETGHGRKSDIWSIGCTTFEMATGKPPLAHMDKMAALFYIGARRGLMPSLPEHFSEDAKNFVQACLTSDPHLRPTAEDLLGHPFVPQLEKSLPA